MTLKELLDIPPEEFRILATIVVTVTKPHRGLHRVKGMTNFLCAIHQLQRAGWNRAPKSETMRITGHSEHTNWFYATWSRKRGTINREGYCFKKGGGGVSQYCRSYSLIPKLFHLYKALSDEFCSTNNIKKTLCVEAPSKSV